MCMMVYLIDYRGTGRVMIEEIDGKRRRVISSSYNEPLLIGNGGGHPKPSEIYVRLHEMLARVFFIRGHAGYYEYDSDDKEVFEADGADSSAMDKGVDAGATNDQVKLIRTRLG